MTHILVTGGNGFLGLHLVSFLYQKGFEVTSLDIKGGDPIVQGDVRDPDFERFLEGVDVVIHAAAALPGWKKPDINSVNVGGTRNVLASCLRKGIGRVVFVSSAGVYGIPDKNPIEESDPLAGFGTYAETKILAERVCQEYRQKGLCIPVIRPMPIVGPKRLGAFQILFDWIRLNKRIPVIGNGSNRYQLLHSDDMNQAILLLLSAPAERVNTEFNVGAKIFGTVREDVQALCDFAATGSKVLKTPAFWVQKTLQILELVRLVPFYRWFYESASRDFFLDIAKIEALGFRPAKNNQETLIETYQWYLENLEESQGVGQTSRRAWREGILRFAKIFF